MNRGQVIPENSAVAVSTGDLNELLTSNELAEKLKVPKSFFYAPCRRKGPDAIPCVRVGKYIRYRMPEVLEWIEKRTQPPA